MTENWGARIESLRSTVFSQKLAVGRAGSCDCAQGQLLRRRPGPQEVLRRLWRLIIDELLSDTRTDDEGPRNFETRKQVRKTPQLIPHSLNFHTRPTR
ncbi:hypothetical protein TNCV_4787621 [Trichonephila clavipes]|nr:hypothetical protein TNCV_4787621 [Trichonephila clavipes]